MSPGTVVHAWTPRVAAATLLAFALAVAAPSRLLAQDGASASAGTRPRVGLALGGGSARGFAHIGVLAWFDEHRIPIDAIAGTSMGGLIGGGFATGMTPAEIRRLIASISWAKVLAPGSPFEDKAFRRKQDARAFPSILQFGLRNGFSLPAGLSASQQVELLLHRIAMPYHATPSFDQFPTPFRCVAVDLEKADTVIFDSGWLALALRATMALPGVFAPVVQNGQTLVDGGVLNNVPADVVAGMGIDVVIAVDVSADLTREKRGSSLLTVLDESLDAMMRAGSRRALSRADIVLAPDLKGFWGIDFDRADELFKRGYAAADAHKTALEKYALNQTDYDAYLASRARLRKSALPAPVYVEVEGVQGDEAADIRVRLARFLLAPLDTNALDREMVAMMGTGRYLSITYRLVSDPLQTGLVVTATPKTNGPPFLLIGLELENNRSTGVAATARGRIWASGATGPGSEFRLDVAVGTLMRAGGEWYQPIGRRGLFVSATASAEGRQFNVFDSSRYSAEYRRTTSNAGVDAGFVIGDTFEWRTGYAVEHVSGRTLIGDPVLPTVSGPQRYFSVQATFDGQSGPTIPDKGLFAHARLRRFTRTADPLAAGEAPSARVEPEGLLSGDFEASVFVPVSRRGRLLIRAAGGSSFGSTTRVNAFTLGGPFALGALNIGELRGSNYALATAGYVHKVYRLAQGAAGTIYAIGWIETGAAFERYSQARIATNLSLGLVIESPLGPISMGASIGLDGRHRFYAGFGPLLRRSR